MIIKQVKEYERKKGTGIFNYRINISKQDNLNSEVAILNLDEYDKIQNNIKQLENQVNNQNNQTNNKTIEYKKQLTNKDNKIKELQNKIIDLEDNIKKHNELIENLNKDNTENINKLNKEHNEKLEKLTALNQILISGLENIKNTGFMDRLTNKNKQLAIKLINDNIKKIPAYEIDLKEK